MSLKKALKKVGKIAMKAAPLISLVPGVGQIAGPALMAINAAKAARGARPQAAPGGSDFGSFDLTGMAMQQVGYAPSTGAVAPSRAPVPRGGVPRGAGGGPVRQGPIRMPTGRPKMTPWGYVGTISRTAASAAGYILIGKYYYDQAGMLVGVKTTRRLNPLNHRALRRAIRRVKSARKICNQVEKIAGPRRRAPPRKEARCR